MENQENNNMSELDQLKAQYETLKQQFDQQEIVNERLMKSSVKHSVDFYKRYLRMQYIVYPLLAIIGLLFVKWFFDNNLSLRLFWVAFCLVCFVAELWMTKMVRFKTWENANLLTLSNHARSFKKLYAIFVVSYAVSIIILVAGSLLSKVGSNMDLKGLFIVLCFVLLGTICLGLLEIRYKTRPCDEIIRQIEASETIENKGIGFDKRQRWFCIAMIVAFLCLDVWAYMIVASHLKLPPMWRQVTYTRTDGSLPMEDDLSIWEVYADTLVASKDVSAVTEQWQQNESLVVVKGSELKTTIEMDELSVHEWKEDDGKQVQLYALKMASPEGPIVSSKRIGGKPVMEKLVVQEPYFNNESEIIPIIIYLTPEARQLWSEFIKTMSGNVIKSIDIALVVDGVVYQKMNFTSIQNVTNDAFYIWREWPSREELEAFCQQLIRQ